MSTRSTWTACQAMTGHGGWPLNVFLTPDAAVLRAGPTSRRPRHGSPSWRWCSSGRRGVERPPRRDAPAGGAIAGRSPAMARSAPPARRCPKACSTTPSRTLAQTFDCNGGCGGAPKFPRVARRVPARAPASATMPLADAAAMASGGIYDQVGGGFARYAIDATLARPALREDALRQRAAGPRLPARLAASAASSASPVCARALDFVAAGACAARGGSARARRRLRRSRGEVFRVGRRRAPRAARSRSWPTRVTFFRRDASAELRARRQRARSAAGPVPARLARSAQSCSKRAAAGRARPRRQAADRLERADDRGAGRRRRRARSRGLRRRRARMRRVPAPSMRAPDGRLLRTWKDGRAHLAAYLEDHAFLLEALLMLYEATFEDRWYLEAALGDRRSDDRPFGDDERGGFFTTAVTIRISFSSREEDMQDAPDPFRATRPPRLGCCAWRGCRATPATRRQRWPELRRSWRRPALRLPVVLSATSLQALDFHRAPAREIAIVGDLSNGAGPLSSRWSETRFRPLSGFGRWTPPRTPGPPPRCRCWPDAELVDGPPRRLRVRALPPARRRSPIPCSSWPCLDG